MSKMNRRNFIKLTSAAGVAAGAATLLSTRPAMAADNRARLSYPARKVVDAGALKKRQPVNFNYPDDDSPCLMLSIGSPVPGGVGPNQDIVAFSVLCTHMGCPTWYDPVAGTLKCPCHYSIFDPEMQGQQVCGQGVANLPQIELEYDPTNGAVRATGVIGLIYGRTANTV